MELMAIMAAHQLAAHPNTNHARDSHRHLGYCQIASRAKYHQQLNNNYLAIMNPLQHYLKDFKGEIRWTPAHPERRN